MSSDSTVKTALSLFFFIVAAAALVLLVLIRHLFAFHPLLIAAQVGAVLLMLWARVTFGRRSFHASANTSKGPLITNGPYRLWRHPIYSSIIYFVWAGQVQSPTPLSLAGAALVTLGLVGRMLLEEQFLRAEYSEYDVYSKRAKRVIPFLF